MNSRIELFVPGRLCLFGEHSNWAGFYCITNENIAVGQAIVTGIEQGSHAFAEKSTYSRLELNINSLEYGRKLVKEINWDNGARRLLDVLEEL